MIETPFLSEIVAVLAAAVVAAFVFEKFRLPAILGFLLAGAIIGPHGVRLLSDVERIHTLAEIGMIFLMLTIGLEFSFEKLRGLKKMAFFGGSAQILLSIGISVLFARFVGWNIYQGF